MKKLDIDATLVRMRESLVMLAKHGNDVDGLALNASGIEAQIALMHWALSTMVEGGDLADITDILLAAVAICATAVANMVMTVECNDASETIGARQYLLDYFVAALGKKLHEMVMDGDADVDIAAVRIDVGDA
jgi:hypothetical protein